MSEFVPFKIAKKLEEKGFNLPILEIYGKFDSDGFFHSQLYCNYCETMDSKEIVAPTISQVLKWLRVKKKLYVEPCILADADTDADGKVITEYTYWSFSITHIETGDMIYFEYEQHIDDKRFDSYEQASLAGIEYILDNNLI